MEQSFRIRGFRFSAVAAGIKTPGSDRLDLGLIVADGPSTTAGVTTTNLVVAAPAEITRERLRGGVCCAVLANSGNANAFTGEQGRTDALELTARCKSTSSDPRVGHRLYPRRPYRKPSPHDRIRPACLISFMADEGRSSFCRCSIMTPTRGRRRCSDGRFPLVHQTRGWRKGRNDCLRICHYAAQ